MQTLDNRTRTLHLQSYPSYNGTKHIILKKDVISEWGRKKAKDIKRRDIIRLLDQIMERDAPIQANRTLACIRMMFNFAVSRDIIEYNPSIGVKAPAPEIQRDRVLNETELKSFWQNLSVTTMNANARNAFKLSALTAQRIGEVVSCRWKDIDLQSGWWVIPAEKAKNKLQHRVPLSPEAIALINEIKKLTEWADSDYLFPSPRAGKHIDVTAIAHALKRNFDKFGIEEKFRPHDLRRTTASHMTGMGISRLVVSKILNHVEPHITAVYDRYSYDEEKRAALDKWSKHLMAIMEGKPEKILPIKSAARKKASND